MTELRLKWCATKHTILALLVTVWLPHTVTVLTREKRVSIHVLCTFLINALSTLIILER